MKKTHAGAILFAIPWLGVAVQHFIYAAFVANIVPAYMPFRLFWVYFTATAMIAAAIAILTGIRTRLAATLLGCMMLLFILMIHLPILTGHPAAINWTRAFQDLAITGAAFMLAGKRLAEIGRYCYAIPLLFLGAQHFWLLPYVTGRIPDWFPLKMIWDYLAGALIILAALAILLRKKDRLAARVLGMVLLLLVLLYHIPELIAQPFVGTDWTAAILDTMIAAGPLILAAMPVSARTKPLGKLEAGG